MVPVDVERRLSDTELEGVIAAVQRRLDRSLTGSFADLGLSYVTVDDIGGAAHGVRVEFPVRIGDREFDSLEALTREMERLAEAADFPPVFNDALRRAFRFRLWPSFFPVDSAPGD